MSLLERLLTKIIPYRKGNLDSTIYEEGFNHQMCRAPILYLRFLLLSNIVMLFSKETKKERKKSLSTPQLYRKPFCPCSVLCLHQPSPLYPLPRPLCSLTAVFSGLNHPGPPVEKPLSSSRQNKMGEVLPSAGLHIPHHAWQR